MYVMFQDQVIIRITDILSSLRHLLLPAVKPLFVDEVDHNTGDADNDIDYQYESTRLESFKDWSISYIKPEWLAAAGFYFTGHSDIVKCFDCHVTLCRWLEGEDPIMEHRRLSPTCSFVSNYQSESVRLQSFRNWPHSYIKPEKLAAAGFYFLQEGDKVRCFECVIEVSQWMETDDPMEEHKRFSPTCKFVNNAPCGNIPIREDSYARSGPSTAQDICGIFDEDQGRLKWAKIHYPNYTCYNDRLKSFEHWDIDKPQTKEELAEAGFFYTGTSDQTVCFCCGLSLYKWEPFEKPWEKHFMWMPTCDYLIMVKGQDFARITEELYNQQPSFEHVEEVPSRPPLMPMERENGFTSRRRRQSQSAQRDLENISDNIAGLSINDPCVEEAAACAAVAESLTPAEQNMLCTVCYSNKRDVLFLNCKHIVVCSPCLTRLKYCPYCRDLIQSSMQIYFA